MDVHVRRAVTDGLLACGVDVITAQEDGAARFPDAKLLDRATELGRLLFSQDPDLLAEANLRQKSGKFFYGVIYGHQMRVSVGVCIRDLEILAKCCQPADLENRVEYLPLK